MSTNVKTLLDRHTFLTNAGTETYLVFQQGFELPEFCGFTVFDDAEAWATLTRDHLEPILEAAAAGGYGLMLDALVWRAQPDYLARLGIDAGRLAAINHEAVSRTRDTAERWRKAKDLDDDALPLLVSADIGPRGDGYQVADAHVTPEAARAYHRPQLQAVADAGADLACALTMTSAAESVGIVQAAGDVGLPVIVSPTVETDGRLPDGTSLGSLIRRVDEATNGAPLLYMVNCAHPTHLLPTLEDARAEGASWLPRFRGFRANASSRSHAELDESTELDRGAPRELASTLARMRDRYDLCVIGGCCGTDHEHLAEMARRAAA